jgi:hypothetical protein
MSTQHGYLLLADISGFTAYLAGTELEHSQAIVGELLELLVVRLRALLTVERLEGDAVFAHAPGARLPRGETLLELIESTYAAFKDRLTTIRRRTTCTCQACQSVEQLDLKFLVHYGEYLLHPIAAQTEIIGLAPNLVRERQLKDQLPANAPGAALFTEPSLQHMRLPLDDWRESQGVYPHIGPVKTYRLDLRARYQALMQSRRVVVAPEEADVSVACDLAAPPPAAWAWLNDPDKRTQWMRGTRWTAGERPGGRTGIGARNHCDHSRGAVEELIVDWRPFDYFTVEFTMTALSIAGLETTRLEPAPDSGGARLRLLIRFTTARWLTPMLKWVLARTLQRDLENLAQLVNESHK